MLESLYKTYINVIKRIQEGIDEILGCGIFDCDFFQPFKTLSRYVDKAVAVYWVYVIIGSLIYYLFKNLPFAAVIKRWIGSRVASIKRWIGSRVASIKRWIGSPCIVKLLVILPQLVTFLFRLVTFPLFLPKYFIDFIFQFIHYFGLSNGNKIKRHRELYSKDGMPLLWFSAKVVFFLPLVLWIVLYYFGLIQCSNLGIWVTNTKETTNVLWSIICQYLDPGNVGNSEGTIGHLLAFIFALLGIVCLSGFLVSAIVNVISQTRIQWQKGLITYENVKDFDMYVVIIGINEQTASIARRALESDDNRYVLIQTRQDVEKVRPELESKIDDDKQDRIVYYAGDRTSYEDIEKLHLENAIEVYVLGERVENSGAKNSDEQVEKEHDAYNISCLEHMSKYIQQYGDNLKKEHKKEEYKEWRNKSRLNVHVQFDYQSTFTAFKATHLYQKLGRDIRFIPFNIHELWAKKVLVDNLAIYPAGNKTELKVQRYRPIDGKDGIGIGKDHNEEKTVHLIILGMNQMGTALATQAALLCHFPNFARDKSKKTVITFIDDNAIREADYYMGRYATLFELSHYTIEKDTGEKIEPIHDHKPNFKGLEFHHLVAEIEKEGKKMSEDCLLDVEWEFINGNAASKAVQKHILNIANDKNKIVTIAICFNDSQQSLASAMYLPKTVYDNCNQVLVYQRSIFDVANDVARGDSDWRRYQNLFPFGMSEASYTENPFDSHLAALDYYMYENEKRFEQVKNYFDETKEYADEQNKHEFEASVLKSVDDAWENAGIVRKTASIDSVDSIPFKLRSMGIEYCRDLDKIEEKISKEEYKEIKDGLVEAEHNRWMMQRLMSGFRHLSLQEQEKSKSPDIEIKDKDIDSRLDDINKKIRSLKEKLNKLIHNEEDEIRSESSQQLSEQLKECDDERNDLLYCYRSRIYRESDSLDRKDICICSFSKMKELYRKGIKNDERVIESIPYLLRGNELLNALILRDEDRRYLNSPQRKVQEEFFLYGTKQQCIKAFLYLKRDEVKKEDEEKYCKHGFWMADTAVTRQQWYKVTGKEPEGYDDKCKEMPVVSVSKKEVEDFLDILRKKSGLYFDLPSLKEWRTAATPEKEKWTVNEGCIYSTKDEKRTVPEEVRKDSECDTNIKRLHHMFGNVWEWTQKMDEHGLFKFAGGSWRFTEKECKINNNNYWWHSWDADSKSDDLGFRLVWKYDRNVLTLKGNENMECDSKNSSNSSEVDTKDVEAIKEWFKRDKHAFVKVESGYFVMGAEKDPNNDPSNKPDANEGPRHSVHISEPFYICQVPVTQSLWNAVMDVKKPRLNPTTNRIGDEIPQTDISWQKGDDVEPGVKEFLEKINVYLEKNNTLRNHILSIIIKGIESSIDEIITDEMKTEIISSYKTELKNVYMRVQKKEKKVPETVQDAYNKLEKMTDTKDLLDTFKSIIEEAIKVGELQFRLPTEAEWEYAAKSGMSIVKNINEESFMKEDKKTYYTINVEKDKDGKLKTDDNELYMRHKDKVREYPIYAKSHFSDGVEELAWFKQRSIHEVAKKMPNALGLYDMSGNVWEWCYDYYIADMYVACKLGNNDKIQKEYHKDEYKEKGYITDPVALDNSYSAHVFRGGSWRSSEWDCRCTRANYWGENYKANDLGFRLVLGRPIEDNVASNN